MTGLRRFLLAATLAGLATSASGTAAFCAYPDHAIRWIFRIRRAAAPTSSRG